MEKLNELIDILAAKRRKLEVMLENTKRQAESITTDSIDELQFLLEKRELCIKEIDSLDDNFKNIYDSLKTQLGVSSLEQSLLLPREKLRELQTGTQGVIDLLKEIQAIEVTNAKKAREIKEELAQEIKKINNSKRVNVAYNYGNSLSQSHFIDTKE